MFDSNSKEPTGFCRRFANKVLIILTISLVLATLVIVVLTEWAGVEERVIVATLAVTSLMFNIGILISTTKQT